MLIGSGVLIVLGCTLVGYGVVQEEARRGMIPAGRVLTPDARREYLSLAAGAVLLLVGVVALFAGYRYFGFLGIMASYVGCNLLTYVWGLVATRTDLRARREARSADPGE